MKCIKTILSTIINILLYALTFYFFGYILKMFYINPNHVYVISLLAGILIYIFKKILKPILNHFTLALTGITFGLFYFVNNAILLKLVELVLNNNVRFNNLFSLFLISFLMTITNFVIKEIILKPILKVIDYE